jgi:hypothetical protein
MSWFSKKKPSDVIESNPELPELPDTNTTPFDYNSSPNTTTPDIPIPPQYGIENKPLTRDIETDTDFINEPKPGMQKSKFSQIGSDEDFKRNLQGLKKASYVKPIEPSPVPRTPIYNPPSPPVNIGKTGGIFRSSVKNIDRRNEPVYIRLDKFQMTIDAFREVKDKIREIEDLLIKTKEIKSREDKEIEEWEREIESIKIKIQSIDKDIFEQS